MILISCQNNVQENKKVDSINYSDSASIEQLITDNKTDFELYDYDTILRGGYNLKYKVYTDSKNDENLQSLTLRKGVDEIKVLNETSFPMLFKNLGYIGADFDSTFIFVQSFGSGNPHYIQLIDKNTGKELRKGTWVDVDEKEQVLLYIENEFEASETLKLYDIKNENEIVISDFQDSKCIEERIGGLRNCVEIDIVTNKIIVLKVVEDSESKKIYNR